MHWMQKGLWLAICLLPAMTWAGPVNVNTADAETIAQELKGIGLAKAEAIVEYREKYGPFKSAEDLALVRGIGERTVEKIKADVLVKDRKP
ncbi:MAG: ComEA family DNA-binding protein [Pseudomonadota bacterium]